MSDKLDKLANKIGNGPMTGLVMIWFMIAGPIMMVWEIFLILLFCGPSLILAGLALFPTLLFSMCEDIVPWESRYRVLRWMGIPFLKCHGLLCKVRGVEQRR